MYPTLAPTVKTSRGSPVRIEFRPASRYWQKVRGWYDPQERCIVVYWHAWWDPLQVEITLVHELAHASGRPGCVGHRRGFRRILVRMAKEQLGVDLGDPGEVAGRLRSVATVENAIWWALVRLRVVGVVHAGWTAVLNVLAPAAVPA